MRALLDTNIIVRHLTGKPPAQAEAATAFLAAAEPDALVLTDLVFAAIVYVLESFYELPCQQLAQRLRAVLAFPALTPVDPPLLLRALEVYERHRLDLANAYLVACAEASAAPARSPRSTARSTASTPSNVSNPRRDPRAWITESSLRRRWKTVGAHPSRHELVGGP